MFKQNVLTVFVGLILSIHCLGQTLNREELIQDVRELAKIFETAHPDPYEGGGGKIAFHRRLQTLILSIPQDGMTAVEFYRILCPFVASLGDGHTSLAAPYRLNTAKPGGLPLYLGIVEDHLYVARVTHGGDEHLLGSLLLSVEGVYLEELILRQKRLRGCDCDLHALNRLAYHGSLWYRQSLELLIPEWENKSRIRCSLRKPDGSTESMTLIIPERISFPLIEPESRFDLPSIDRCDFVYDFLDPVKSVALLRIDKMNTYRESFELDEALGLESRMTYAMKLHFRYNKGMDFSGLIEGLPSATETFSKLVEEMKGADTKILIIDIRRNQGGYSLMSDILFFFLYGKQRLLDYRRNDPAYEITKYSDLYFDRIKSASMERINQDRPFTLFKDDYDFSHEFSKDDPPDEKAFAGYMERWAARSPTFYQAYQLDQDVTCFHPEQVLIICSPLTYSSGYGMLYRLYRAGASLVGTPSAQGGNAYGDLLSFVLKNSRLRGWVSRDYIVHFPDDPGMGKVLQPHHPLTYDKLESYGFDPNSEILLALEIVKRGGEGGF